MAYATLGITMKKDAIEKDKCFFGLISRQTAEVYLMDRASCSGSYLIREGEDGYRLSVLAITEEEKEVIHYKIERLFNQTYCIEPKVSFPSIESLITYYKDSSKDKKMDYPLTIPCPKHIHKKKKSEKPLLEYKNLIASSEYVHEEVFTKISRDSINLKSIITSGAFSDIWKGNVMSYENAVAIKIENEEDYSRKFLAHEAEMMTKISHDNIVRLIGVSSDEIFCLLMDFQEHRDLVDYLLRYGIYEVSFKERLRFAYEVTLALQHIAQSGHVHRNICASNVLLNSKRTCKLTGFGYAAKLDKNGVYREREDDKPFSPNDVRWMSPEVAELRKFSTPSDIWSLGCVFFEIFSNGEVPFSGTFTSDVLEKVKDGYRSPKPINTSNAMYSVMLKCWYPEALERPTLIGIEETLINLREPPNRISHGSSISRSLPASKVLTQTASVAEEKEKAEEKHNYLKMKPLSRKIKKS